MNEEKDLEQKIYRECGEKYNTLVCNFLHDGTRQRLFGPIIPEILIALSEVFGE